MKDLTKPFPVNEIVWRVGRESASEPLGTALACLTEKSVQHRLDAVVGPQNWQTDYTLEGHCRLGIRNKDEWVWKTGVKSKYLSAFIRAGVQWGIGLYLYDLPDKNFPIERNGNYAYFSNKTIKELQKFLNDWQKVSVPKQERIEFANQARDLLSKGDEFGLKEIFDEYDADQKIQLWPEFNSTERSAIKKLMEV